MKISDYFVLAKTKIRTRKLRSINTMISASVLISGLLIGSFVFTGIRNSIKDVVVPGLEDIHLSVESSITYPVFQYDDEGDYTEDDLNTSLEEHVERLGSREYVAVHEQSAISGEAWHDRAGDIEDCTVSNFQSYGPFGIEDEPDNYDSQSCASVAVRSDALFEYFVEDEVVIDSGAADAIPATLSSKYALGLSGNSFGQRDEPAVKLEKIARAKQEVIGQTYTIAVRVFGDDQTVFGPNVPPEPISPDAQDVGLESPDALTVQNESEFPGDSRIIRLTIKVVGVLPDQNEIKDLAGVYSFGVDSAGIVLQRSGVEQSASAIANYMSGTFLFTEFASSDELHSYVLTGCTGFDCVSNGVQQNEIFYYTDYDRAIDRTGKDAWSFFRWVVLIASIGVGISVMSTMGKVMADSRKEIGVFRAIGATRTQIAGVYATYTAMLVAIAAILSTVIARIITAVLDGRFAANISTQLALLKSSGQAEGHFSFFGFNPLHFLAIVGFVLLVGLVGSALPVIRTLRRDPLRYLRDD